MELNLVKNEANHQHPIQFKNFNHPTRGNFVVVMAGSYKNYIKLREQYNKQKSFTLTVV